MKIKISFDSSNINEILSLAKQFDEYYTHIIIGTIPLYLNGISIIQNIKSELPKKPIIAKIRLTDYAQQHAELFASLGIYGITVAPGINTTMLHAAVVAAHNNNIKIFLELFDTTYINQAAFDAKNIGVDGTILHCFYDSKNPQTIEEQWDFVKGNITIPTFIDTTITTENISSLFDIKPDGLIISEEFMRSKNAPEQFKLLHEMIKTESY